MTERSRYWRSVLILMVLFCVLAALGYWVAPGVRAGSVPAIGGVVWHALGAIQLLIANVYGPIAARVAEAISPRWGTVMLLALTVGSAFLLAMVIGLRFYLIDKSSNRLQPPVSSEKTTAP